MRRSIQFRTVDLPEWLTFGPKDADVCEHRRYAVAPGPTTRRWLHPGDPHDGGRLGSRLRLPRGSRAQDDLRGHELHDPPRRRATRAAARHHRSPAPAPLPRASHRDPGDLHSAEPPVRDAGSRLGTGAPPVGAQRLHRTGAGLAGRLHHHGQTSGRDPTTGQARCNPNRGGRSGPAGHDRAAARRGRQLPAEPVHHRRARERQDLDRPGPSSSLGGEIWIPRAIEVDGHDHSDLRLPQPRSVDPRRPVRTTTLDQGPRAPRGPVAAS